MSSNPTKSLCNPYVFNTALSRAQSLVVAVGNPFTLMRVEEAMGRASRGGPQKCSWKEYVRVCLEEETVCFSSNTSRQEHSRILAKLKMKVGLIADDGQWSGAVGGHSLYARDEHHSPKWTQTAFTPRPHPPEKSGMIGKFNIQFHILLSFLTFAQFLVTNHEIGMLSIQCRAITV